MLEYIIKSALLLSVLYGSFALLLSRETFHRFNRMALLSVLVASLVLPLIEIEVPYEVIPELESPLSKALPRGGEASAARLLPLGGGREGAERFGEGAVRNEDLGVEGALLLLYLLGVVASLAIFFVQIFRLWRELKGGVRTRDERGNTVVVRGGDFPPFSFLHYIIINASDYEHLRRPILAHEQAHIRLRHTFDLLLLEAVKALQWFNPFVYLLGRDLKAVHEYEADDAVLSFGIDAKTYQLLLVTKAVGSRLQTVCNNLSHHSLKKRIKMMHKNKSDRWLMGKALILPALMALALVAWAKPCPRPASPSGNGASAVADSRQGDTLRMIKVVKNPKSADRGDCFVVTWLKGTWVEKDDGSFVEEHPVCKCPYGLRTKDYTFMLDGQPLDIHNLPDLPASALKKMELSFKNHSVNLITKAVRIPADVKGNINPELTILLTGTPPKDSGAKTTIWERSGHIDSFSWKNYTICSWKWNVDDISCHLRDVAIRTDHSVRINVCRGVPQDHIERITRLMQECGVTNYKFVRQQ